MEPDERATRCPRCNFEAPPELEAFSDCPRCGVVVAKALRDQYASQAEAMPARKTFSQIVREKQQRPIAAGFDREVRWGAALGALLWLLPFTRALGSYLNILVHEIGHTLTYWLFGYLTVPSFDFVNHGGLSVAFARLESLTLVVVALFGLWIWQARGYPRIQALAIVLLLIYSALNWTSGHQHLFDAMGHGGELVFATIFLAKGLAPAYRLESFERPLWSAAGSFVTLQLAAFSWALALSSERQREYLYGIRGFRHDLHRLAEWSGIPLGLLAALLGALALSTPLLAFQWHRHAGRWRRQLHALLGSSRTRGH